MTDPPAGGADAAVGLPDSEVVRLARLVRSLPFGSAGAFLGAVGGLLAVLVAAVGLVMPAPSGASGAGDEPGSELAYDAAGRRLSETTGSTVVSYGYDPLGRHVELTQPTAAGTTSQVRDLDPLGRPGQLTNTTGSATSVSLLDWDPAGLGSVAGWQTDGATSTITAGPAGPVSQTLGAIRSALAKDEHGSVYTSNPSPVVWARGYSPYGEAQGYGTSSLTLPTLEPRVGYRGELSIGSLVDLRARTYDPSTGSFISQDPLTDVEATTTVGNPFHYVDNNPLNRVDPTGMRPSGDATLDDLAAAGYEERDLAGMDCRAMLSQFEGLCIKANAGRHESLAGQLVSGATDGLKAGITSLNPISFLRSLWDSLWNLANQPGQIIDALEALADADPRMLMDAALSVIGIDMEKCNARGYGYCIAHAVTEGAAGSGGLNKALGLVKSIVDKIKDLKKLKATADETPSGTAQARQLGAQGESLAGIDPSVVKTRIPSLTDSAKYRVPDQLTDSVLTEVKNVKRLGFTPQIQDFSYYATQTGRRFDLVVRQNTVLTRELEDLVNMTGSPINLIRGLPAR